MQAITLTLLQYKYLALLPLAVAEGPVIALVAGFLVHVDVLEFWPTYAILLVGDLVPDTVFYALGYVGGRSKFAAWLLGKSTFLVGQVEAVTRLWARHPCKTMVFGKLAYGLGLPVLSSGGAVRLPFGRFVGCAVPISLAQYGVILGLGYALGGSYALAKDYVVSAYAITAVGVVCFVAGYILLARYARRQFLATSRQDSGPHRRDGA